MGARHSGREAALQMLFQMEASFAPSENVIDLFWRSFDPDPEGRAYADAIVRGLDGSRDKVDAEITKASAHWRLERMTRVDRNILRLGAWELLEQADVPVAVILDEGVELAKSYGTEESGAFVNGVLNRVAENLGRKIGGDVGSAPPAPAGSI
jgi:N utilization substance protein B